MMQVLQWDKQTKKKLKTDFASHFDATLSKKVGRILNEVRLRGDLALRKFTREFDGVEISAKKLAVNQGDINRAFEKIEVKFVPLLKQITQNVQEYYEKELKDGYEIQGEHGVHLSKKYSPLERIGVYVPAGTAPLVSTVYMSVIPAKVAGVKEIVMVTPPNKETGEIDPHILAVANLLGVAEIYRCGGAQAIGALAYGTKTIKKVDKIVGPGNAFVAEAKRQVYGFCDIDMVAGPSEVAILADAQANPDYVTCDLLAQAEHHGGTSYLITNSKKLIESMRKRLDTGVIIQVKSLTEGCEVINELAPEHLEIMTEKPHKYLEQVRNAGAIFLGEYSPAVVGDYIAGPSHVLPTGGTARYFSPLSAATFIKSTQIIHYTKEAIKHSKEHVQKLTDMEGLYLHRISMEARLVDKQKTSKRKSTAKAES